MDLEFKVRLKPKNRKLEQNVSAFPPGIFDGIFTGLSVEVYEQDAISEIYKHGCYGKGSSSRGAPEKQDEWLVLQLEEAFFLAYVIDVLRIKDADGKLLDYQQLLHAGLLLNPKFTDTLAAYIYLKSKNWVVKAGSKFGGDYIIYKMGPDVYHASFVVYVLQPDESDLWKNKNMKCIQRVAENSNKDVLLLEVTKPENFLMNNLEDLNQITVAELIIRRLKMNAFVHSMSVNQ